MGDRQSNVLVKMKQLDVGPREIAAGDKRRQEMNLGVAGGGDDASGAAGGQDVGEHDGGTVGGGTTQGDRVVEKMNIHGGPTLDRPPEWIKRKERRTSGQR